MSSVGYPIGMQIDVSFPNFFVNLTLLSETKLKFEIKDGPFARTETVEIQVIPLGNSIFSVSWQEKDGATVTNVQDFDRGLVHSYATLPNNQFLRMTGTITVTRSADRDFDDCPHRNKALVLEAMTSLFQRHETSTIDRLYSPSYIQHNPNIPQGRDALKELVKKMSPDVYYEPGLIVAQGDLVAIHGRIRGWAEAPQVVVDLFRIEAGKLAEHWDVLQNEVPGSKALGKIPMFGAEEIAYSSHLGPA
ncbi:nuclear transport factor 2 family protein [Herbaspirillum sp. GCM10030257]|uniref:nuclear transport factor 2 family protein n=1 Tax=Herbaspirillum sp. GCM10030257 TaxID=3273393 RepID=UPI00361631D3